ncbi:uncharacterized protein [Diadema antillarum]|uniref:uncharacterized protein isoform X2 n=1 Tax=Diadema antillarum TaxID=105358 RepID=UPI003A8883C6
MFHIEDDILLFSAYQSIHDAILYNCCKFCHGGLMFISLQIQEQHGMPLATMANPPEHDFAPSWLKIPNDNRLIAKQHSDQRAGSNYPSYAEHSDSGRQRSRHFSNESSYQGFPARHPPQPNIHGYRSREEKRIRPGPRYHSLEDPMRHSEFPSAYAPLNNGFLPPPHSLGYYPSSDYHHALHIHGGKRGSPLHHNLNRLDSHNYHGRNVYGGEGGRSRYSGGGGANKHRGGGLNDKAGPEPGESCAVENSGTKVGSRNKKGEGGSEDGEGDKSALSSHDFPSLSGEGDDVKNESSKPSGAWEKRPGTAKINIGGKKLQLVQKTTASDSLTAGSTQTPSKMSAPSSINGVGSMSTATKMAPAQTSSPSKGPKAGRAPVSLSSTSTSVYKSLIPSKTTAPSKATMPRKPIAKEVVMRPAPVISSKEKPTPPVPSSSSASSLSSSSTSISAPSPSATSPSGGVALSQPSSSAPPIEAFPHTSPAIDIPTPRMVTGKVKRTEKIDFLKELRRSGSVDSPRSTSPPQGGLINGLDQEHHHHNHHHNQHHFHRSSTKQYNKSNSTPIYQQPDPFDDTAVEETPNETRNSIDESSMCNGHLSEEAANEDEGKEEEPAAIETDFITSKGHRESMPTDETNLDCQPMELSSSLEAEKRFLQEMGWHEHSDNEEGYAPITEDELREFKLRSQQIKRNGFNRPQPFILNHIPHPVMSAITAMTIEDAELTSSDDDSSDDDL